MPIPDWTPSLSVGNAKLDEQHLTLLEIARHLLSLLDKQAPHNEEIHIVLKDFAGLSREHDATEEKILEENECPSLAEHKMAHAAARAALDEMLLSASQNLLDKAILVRALGEWKIHHICECDLPLSMYMKAKPR
jgi:hemerythrin